MDNPRNKTVLPCGSTNLLPLTEIKAIFLAFEVYGRPPTGRSFHHW